MYGQVLSTCASVAATVCTAAVLPNTGVVSNNIVAFAIAVLVGLVTWGVAYSRTNR